MIELLTSPEAWLSLASLAALEIVLGIDNIVFITVLTGRLPVAERPRARRLGLAGALVGRIGLLFAISAVMGLTEPLVTVLGEAISGRDLILLLGGVFLLWKSATEIFHVTEGGTSAGGADGAGARTPTFAGVVAQVLLLDLVFSLDSVITAVGMADHIAIMCAAILISVGVMLVFADSIGEFVEEHPSIKLLALAFLLMVGALLIAEGFDRHVPKGYVYFAMGFSLAVELLNMRRQKRRAAGPVALRPGAFFPEGGDSESPR